MGFDPGRDIISIGFVIFCNSMQNNVAMYTENVQKICCCIQNKMVNSNYIWFIMAKIFKDEKDQQKTTNYFWRES